MDLFARFPSDRRGRQTIAEFLAAISTSRIARRQRSRGLGFLLENRLLPWKLTQHSSNSAIFLKVSAMALWFLIKPGATPT